MAPPSASISLTRWPLPMPPIDGLQLIWPSVSMLCVSSSVAQPMRAAASAASVPAWPPPTTMTSNRSGNSIGRRRILRERSTWNQTRATSVGSTWNVGSVLRRSNTSCDNRGPPRPSLDLPRPLCRAARAARNEADYCRVHVGRPADRDHRARRSSSRAGRPVPFPRAGPLPLATSSDSQRLRRPSGASSTATGPASRC